MTKQPYLSLLLLFTAMPDAFCRAEERTFVSSDRLTLGTGANRSASVRTADVDGDGDIDLIVANGRHWPQQKLYSSIKAIVVGNVGTPNAVYFNCNSETAFDETLFGAADMATYGLCTGDLNGDGFSDVAVANSDGVNQVVLNQTKKISEQSDYSSHSVSFDRLSVRDRLR